MTYWHALARVQAEQEIAELTENAEEADVEHIPGVTLSVDIRVNAAKCRVHGAELRLAVLKSSSSALGNLCRVEQTLLDKIGEVEDDLKLQEAHLKKHDDRAEKVPIWPCRAAS